MRSQSMVGGRRQKLAWPLLFGARDIRIDNPTLEDMGAEGADLSWRVIRVIAPFPRGHVN